MGNVSGIVEQVKHELERAKEEVQRFGAALAALGGSTSNARRTLSAAARRKISLAQKARWAKRASAVQVASVRPKRTLSASAGRKIAAAQRVRWAKVKGRKKAK